MKDIYNTNVFVCLWNLRSHYPPSIVGTTQLLDIYFAKSWKCPWPVYVWIYISACYVIWKTHKRTKSNTARKQWWWWIRAVCFLGNQANSCLEDSGVIRHYHIEALLQTRTTRDGWNPTKLCEGWHIVPQDVIVPLKQGWMKWWCCVVEYQGCLCFIKLIKPQLDADFVERTQPIARELCFSSFFHCSFVTPYSGIIAERVLKRQLNQT